MDINVTPPSIWGSNYFIAVNSTNEASGTYWLGVTQLPTAPTLNGNASLVTLTFKITYDPIYPENVTSLLHLTDTYLSDNLGNPIPHTDMDGGFKIWSKEPEIYFDPPIKLVKKIESFNVTVKVAHAVNLYSYEIGVSWDPRSLQLVKFALGDFLQYPLHTYCFYYSKAGGYLQLGVTSDPPAPPANGTGALATLTFMSLPYVWPDPDVNTTIALDVEVNSLVTNHGVSVQHSIDNAQTLVMMRPIPGDVNNDGHVDLVDLRLVARAIGTRPGDTYWDPRCDLKRDGSINIFDLVLVSKNYGRTDP